MRSRFFAGEGRGWVRVAANAVLRGERRLIAAGLALLGSLALLALPAYADVASSPAKTTAARSAVGIDLANAQTINVQLYKGKRRTMLVVHGSVSAYHQPSGFIRAAVTANGIQMEPTDFAGSSMIQGPCEFDCTLSGTWWLDLDLAEKAHPGMFVNVPISVKLQSDAIGSTLSYTMSVTATLMKK